MKLKKFITSLTSSAVVFSLFASNAVLNASAEDFIISDEEATGSEWNQIISVKDPFLDVSAFTEGCTVVVEYTGDPVEAICQSWSDPNAENGEIWARIAPTTDENGVATFSYDDLYAGFVEKYSTGWDYFDGFYIEATEGESTVQKVYITYGSVSTEAVIEQTTTVTPTGTVPTISFDSKAWTNYVKLTPDASLAGIELSQTTTDSYQATSLVVNANMTSALGDGKWPTFAKTARNQDGKILYPDASAEGTETVAMGFELNASDYGLESFNGCTVEFVCLFNETAAEVLVESCMYVYPADGEYNSLSTHPVEVTIDTVTRNNIDYYDDGFIVVANQADGQEAATKLIFELPFVDGYQGEVLRMDNIIIKKPDGTVCSNVDSYNSTFSPRNKSDGKIQAGSAKVVEIDDNDSSKETVKEEKSGFKPIIILVVILIIGAVGLVIVLIIKTKNRYY